MEYYEGEIIRILRDDTEGSRHQRFIIRLASGQSLLIAHNIDLAPRIPDVNKGAWVKLYGEYEWNDLGGLIHWTHADPNGEHEGGWIEFKGQRYE